MSEKLQNYDPRRNPLAETRADLKGLAEVCSKKIDDDTGNTHHIAVLKTPDYTRLVQYPDGWSRKNEDPVTLMHADQQLFGPVWKHSLTFKPLDHPHYPHKPYFPGNYIVHDGHTMDHAYPDRNGEQQKFQATYQLFNNSLSGCVPVPDDHIIAQILNLDPNRERKILKFDRFNHPFAVMPSPGRPLGLPPS